MKVHINFQSISGQSFSGNFSKKSKIHEICNFIAKKQKSRENKIFLVSNNPEEFFYKGDINISDILQNKHDHIAFYNLNIPTESNILTENPRIMQNTKITKPPISAMKVYSNIKKIRHITPISMMFYRKYSDVIRNVPYDFENKVTHISQLGYDKEECKEVLRETDYNVDIAIEILIQRYNNDSNEENRFMQSRIRFIGLGSPHIDQDIPRPIFSLNSGWGRPSMRDTTPSFSFRRNLNNSESNSENDEDQDQYQLQNRRPFMFRNARRSNPNTNDNQSTKTANDPSNDSNNQRPIYQTVKKPPRPYSISDRQPSPPSNKSIDPPTQSEKSSKRSPKNHESFGRSLKTAAQSRPKPQTGETGEEKTSSSNHNQNQHRQKETPQRPTTVPHENQSRPNNPSISKPTDKTTTNRVTFKQASSNTTSSIDEQSTKAETPSSTSTKSRYRPNNLSIPNAPSQIHPSNQTEVKRQTTPTRTIRHSSSTDESERPIMKPITPPSLPDINSKEDKANSASSHSIASQQNRKQKTVTQKNSPRFSPPSSQPETDKNETKQSFSNSSTIRHAATLGDIKTVPHTQTISNRQPSPDSKSRHITLPLPPKPPQSKKEVHSPQPQQKESRPSPHLPEKPKVDDEKRPFNGRGSARANQTEQSQKEKERGSRVRMPNTEQKDSSVASPRCSNMKKKDD